MGKRSIILSTCTALCLASGMITTAMAEDTADDASLSYELASEDQTGADFSCVIDENGEVYWALAVSSFDKLNAMVPDDVESAKIQVLPQNDEEYPYLYPDSEWKIFVNEAEMPSWFSDESVESITAAFEEWKAEAYSQWQQELLEMIDVDSLNQTLTGLDLDYATPMTEDLFEMLKEWVAVWNEEGVAGYINIEVSTLGYKQVGPSVWGAMDGTVLANYKSMDHEGCPGPTTSSFIAAYALEAYGKEIDAATDDYMGSTMNDAYSSLVGSFIKDFCVDEAGNYKYQVAADLWEAGCIPFYDGEYWYLVSGPDYNPDGNPAVEVIYSATNDQLLDDSFTYEAESAE